MQTAEALTGFSMCYSSSVCKPPTVSGNPPSFPNEDVHVRRQEIKAGLARQTRAEPSSQSSNTCINYLVPLGATQS